MSKKVSPLKGRKKTGSKVPYLNGICEAKVQREGTDPEALFMWRQKITLRNGWLDPLTNPDAVQGNRKGEAPEGIQVPSFDPDPDPNAGHPEAGAVLPTPEAEASGDDEEASSKAAA